MTLSLRALRHAEAAYDAIPDEVWRALKRGTYVVPKARGTDVPKARGTVVPKARGTDLPKARGTDVPAAGRPHAAWVRDCAHYRQRARELGAALRAARTHYHDARGARRRFWRAAWLDRRAQLAVILDLWQESRAERDRAAAAPGDPAELSG